MPMGGHNIGAQESSEARAKIIAAIKAGKKTAKGRA